MRRAKIVCTLGPAVASPERIRALVDAGMDMARMNLSHGAYAEHEKVYQWVREAADASGRAVGVLVDLQGPKIRLGTFANGPVTVQFSDEITITIEDVPGDRHLVSTTYKGLPADVHEGDSILIDDGKVALQAIKVDETSVRSRVIEGGVLSNNKGINLPGVAVSVPAMSAKDIADLRWALHLRADWIALSFVRNGADAQDVRRIMDEEGVRLPVLAKVEKPQAVEHLEEIVTAFNGIMVARGDLGVELPLEQVPLVQKRAVQYAREFAKPAIVATQMLESMISASRPTRAEASDVANAVLDGADALMLSGETSVGKYAVESVRTMARIIEAVEAEALHRVPGLMHPMAEKGGAICEAAARIGHIVGAKYLVAFTETGYSARRMAQHRSSIPLLAFTPDASVRSQLSLAWGIETFLVPTVHHTDDMVRQVDAALLAIGRCEIGDLVVVVAGSPPGIPGSTNALRVHRMGDAVHAAAPAYV